MKSIYVLLIFAVIISLLTSSKPLDNFSRAIVSTATNLTNTQAKALEASPWHSVKQVFISRK